MSKFLRIATFTMLVVSGGMLISSLGTSILGGVEPWLDLFLTTIAVSIFLLISLIPSEENYAPGIRWGIIIASVSAWVSRAILSFVGMLYGFSGGYGFIEDSPGAVKAAAPDVVGGGYRSARVIDIGPIEDLLEPYALIALIVALILSAMALFSLFYRKAKLYEISTRLYLVALSGAWVLAVLLPISVIFFGDAYYEEVALKINAFGGAIFFGGMMASVTSYFSESLNPESSEEEYAEEYELEGEEL